MCSQISKFPLVTIAIPTFERSDLLERALNSVALQDYPNFEVLVADNDPNKESAAIVVEKFKRRISNIRYFQHKKNIGGINNFFFLLDRANGDYFMWLADDDEIFGSGYVSELALILCDNPKAATAFANWKLMSAPNCGIVKKSRDYRSNFWLFRVLKFIWYARDDFFYGLHRVDFLKNANKVSYWWLNKEIVVNWAYPYLLDMIIQGGVVQSRCGDIAWINHDYTDKKYIVSNSHSNKVSVFREILRRINIHYIYWIKILKCKSILFLPLVMMVSLMSICKEFSRLFYAKIRRFIK